MSDRERRIEIEKKVRAFEEVATGNIINPMRETEPNPYSKYFKDVSDLNTIDSYELNRLFPVDDPTGCILHARKKLLLPAVRTGGKTLEQEVREARDTLNRWLEINGGERND